MDSDLRSNLSIQSGQKEASAMRTSLWFKSMYLVFSVLMGSAMLSARTPAPCQSGKPTTESSNWDFPKEASEILSQIRVDSFQIRDSAALLRVDDRNADLVGWQAESDLLSQLRDQVNQMDSNICRLRTIAPMTTAEQQQAINRILPQMVVRHKRNAVGDPFSQQQPLLSVGSALSRVRRCPVQLREPCQPRSAESRVGVHGDASSDPPDFEILIPEDSDLAFSGRRDGPRTVALSRLLPVICVFRKTLRPLPQNALPVLRHARYNAVRLSG